MIEEGGLSDVVRGWLLVIMGMVSGWDMCGSGEMDDMLECWTFEGNRDMLVRMDLLPFR